MLELWPEMLRWADAGKPFVLARVLATWGSAPRLPGSAMLVDTNLRVAGSVSGGCIEGAVLEEARQVLQGGPARQVSFGVENEQAWAVGLTCGGQVTVRVELHPACLEASRPAWEALRAAVAQKRPAVLVTRLRPDPESHLLVYPEGGTAGGWGASGAAAAEAAAGAYARRESGMVRAGAEELFAQIFPRPDRLLIIGAAHITVHLVELAKALGFETTVIDPRGVFASPGRFPVAPDRLLVEWPEQVLAREPLDEDCYAVLLTHDPKIDDEALRLLLKSPVAYIGALGSRKTQAKRLARLAEAGFSPEELARVKGPAGLEIGALTPPEIALSILAEVVQARRSRAR